MPALEELAPVALAAAAAALTITKSSFFRPARLALHGRIHWALFKLISCPYCALHWTAAFFVGATASHWTHPYGALGLVIAWLATVALGALLHSVIMFLTPFEDD